MAEQRERVPPPYPGVRLRAFRAADDIWEEAVAMAAELGESLSEQIRQFLQEYVKEGRKRLARRGKK